MSLPLLGALLPIALLLLRTTNAQSTVTVSYNTAVCPVNTGLPAVTISPTVIIYPTTVSGIVSSVTSTSYDTITESATPFSGIPTTPTTGGSPSSTLPTLPPTDSPCPASLFMLYQSTADVTYELLCDTDFLYNDLPGLSVGSFSACINACDQYVPTAQGDFGDLPCVAVTFVGENPNGDNCYLKSSIDQVVYGDPLAFSAKQALYNPPIGNVAVSVIQSTTTTLPVPTTTTIPVPATSTIAPASSFQSLLPCPFANNTVVSADTSGRSYTVLCSVDFLYDDLPATLAYTFSACIEACDSWVPDAAAPYNQSCIGVTYIGYNPNGNGDNCYLKSGIYAISYTDTADSALLLGQSENPATTGSVAPASATIIQPPATSTTASTTISAPTNTASPCPLGNNTQYLASNGDTFNVLCAVDYEFYDLPSTNTTTLTGCIEVCASYIPTQPGTFGDLACVGITWVLDQPIGNNCFLHSAMNTTGTDTDYDSAIISTYTPSEFKW